MFNKKRCNNKLSFLKRKRKFKKCKEKKEKDKVFLFDKFLIDFINKVRVKRINKLYYLYYNKVYLEIGKYYYNGYNKHTFYINNSLLIRRIVIFLDTGDKELRWLLVERVAADINDRTCDMRLVSSKESFYKEEVPVKLAKQLTKLINIYREKDIKVII